VPALRAGVGKGGVCGQEGLVRGGLEGVHGSTWE
jgi:hypothetical protein